MKIEVKRTSLRPPLFCAFVACVLCNANAQTASTPTAVTQATAKRAPDPRSLVLVGNRFKPIAYDEMTPEQKVMIDHRRIVRWSDAFPHEHSQGRD